MIKIEMILVKGGTFQMGFDAPCSNESPVHLVTVSDFEIGKYLVTQKQWEAVMGQNPSRFKDRPNHPVENVSWNDVQKFLEKLNAKTGLQYRLPTEAEWEFAARGGNESQGYVYAGSNDPDEVAWNSSNSGNNSQPVGQKKPNELGIHDMSGNVWEWCSDWYDTYPSGPQTNPKGPDSGYYRVIRGGSWFSLPQSCRVAIRFNVTPGIRAGVLGFRLAMSL